MITPTCPKCHNQRLRCANGCTWEVTDKPIRSQETLESFAAFCQANPCLRFWQALAVWEGSHGYICVCHGLSSWDVLVQSEDTFYREGK